MIATSWDQEWVQILGLKKEVQRKDKKINNQGSCQALFQDTWRMRKDVYNYPKSRKRNNQRVSKNRKNME